jgi:predicted extracellular nuclease
MITGTIKPFAKPRIARFSLFVAAALFAASPALAQKEYSIADIQGKGNTSPRLDEKVTVTGTVTAIIKTGFFIQTPDDRTDKDPSTSEGIFVFTKNAPPLEAAVGNSVSISGAVEEYKNRNDANSPTVTEINHFIGRDSLKVISKANALPKPVILTTADFAPNTLDQLEKYEGMRVSIPEMTTVAPTGGRVDIKTASSMSDGVFYGVLKGTPRPFRTAGLDIREFNEKLRLDHQRLQIFDTNPEIVRVDTGEQWNPASVDLSDIVQQKGVKGDVRFATPNLNMPAQTELTNLTGVLHSAFGRYTILADYDKKLGATASIKSKPLPAPSDRQFSIAGMNLENFFDDVDDPGIKEDVLTPEAFQRRLKKVSMAIRDYMQMPDVIGVVEVENLSTLRKLAEKINSDAAAAGKPSPGYEAFLIDGNDGRGIDNGFLVKKSRVKVLEVRQFGKDDKYVNPNTKEDNFLNDRPPLLLRAAIEDPKTGKPYEFTIVVNHLKSFNGYSDPKQMDNVRTKKRLQAEYLAKLVQERLKASPGERIALLGDFNAFQFNDGVMDVIGTIKGKPAGKDEVLMASEDLVNPDLVDLVDAISVKERYSYVYDGSAQVLDHMLLTETFTKSIKGFGFARVNADFPESMRNDDARVERFSDHDPAVAFFSLD